jgi:vacuolar-type H+-ATPase subunit I/STV1
MIETANTVDHRVARLEAENKRLRDALEKISKAWDTDLYTWDLYLIAKEALKGE